MCATMDRCDVHMLFKGRVIGFVAHVLLDNDARESFMSIEYARQQSLTRLTKEAEIRLGGNKAGVVLSVCPVIVTTVNSTTR